jgi:hypothetical protein
VGALAAGKGDGFPAVAGLGDHFQARLMLQKCPQTATHDGVVIGDQDTDRTHDALSSISWYAIPVARVNPLGTVFSV